MDKENDVLFFLVAAEDGRCFKLSVKRSEAHALKVKKIRKTLTQLTNLSPESFELVHHERRLLDHMTGHHFDLKDDTRILLKMIRTQPVDLVDLQKELIAENPLFEDPTGRTEKPRVEDLMMVKIPTAPSSSHNSLVVTNTRLSDEQRQLMQQCSKMDARKHELQTQLRELRVSLDASRQRDMEQWDAQRAAFATKLQKLQRDWEAQKELCHTEGMESVFAEEIDKQRREVMGKWNSDCQVLFSIWAQDRAEWEKEKNEIALQQNAARQNRRAPPSEDIVRKVAAAREAVMFAQRDLKCLRGELVVSRAHVEECRLMVKNATATLDDVRQRVQQQVRGEDAAVLSKQLVSLVTEVEIDKERARQLKTTLEMLSTKWQQESAVRKNLHNVLEDMKGNVRVILRMRPLLDFERKPTEQHKHLIPVYQEEGQIDIMDSHTVRVTTPTMGGKNFDYYRVLGETTTQEDMYVEVAPLVQSALDGYNVCILAYGQTGSGKTYTIMGDGRTSRGRGVVQRSIDDVFGRLKALDPELRWNVSCTMCELYLDDIRDLLGVGTDRISVHQTGSGFSAGGLSAIDVASPLQALELMQQGAAQRQVHATLMNPTSSRSHAIFTLHVRIEGPKSVRTSKIVFVDLAGSERVSKSHSTGERLKEAMHINKSLSALGDVIAALSQGQSFVPYRNSKLTMLLQEVIGGNSKTLMCTCICPGTPWSSNLSETVSTLSFASRVRSVRNTLTRNTSDL